MHIKPNPEWIDDENPELTDAWFARARPASEVLPSALYAALTAPNPSVRFTHVTDSEHAVRLQKMPKQGRPKGRGPKKKINVWISLDVLSALRATGRGWETRMDSLLREALEQGRI